MDRARSWIFRMRRTLNTGSRPRTEVSHFRLNERITLNVLLSRELQRSVLQDRNKHNLNIYERKGRSFINKRKKLAKNIF